MVTSSIPRREHSPIQPPLPEGALFARFLGSRLQAGIYLALLAGVIIQVLIGKMRLGYEITFV